MRLSPGVDLAAICAEAQERVDRAFARRVPASPFAAAHAEKARGARAMLAGGMADAAIAIEAEGRGIEPIALAAMIVTASERAAAALLAIEIERQAAKARVSRAPDQHAVLAILAEIEAR